MGGASSSFIQDNMEVISSLQNNMGVNSSSLQNHPNRHNGQEFPGSDYHPPNRKNWMARISPSLIRVNQIVWPGTHNSATNEIGATINPHPSSFLWVVGKIIDPLTSSCTSLFAECQNESIYTQLVNGVRVLDIRIGENRCVMHAFLQNYPVSRVLDEVKRFLSETTSEILILQIRTEFGHEDPPNFDEYLVNRLGDDLIHENDDVFGKTIAELLPRRVICVWKPKSSSSNNRTGNMLWNSRYLRDDWLDTNVPVEKFNHNLRVLQNQPNVSNRNYFYRVENTLTHKLPQTILLVNSWISPFARFFISQAFARGIGDKLQIFSADFITPDFVDACVGATYGRIQNQ